MDVKGLLQYLKDNPHEAEDDEGMCRYYEEVGKC